MPLSRRFTSGFRYMRHETTKLSGMGILEEARYLLAKKVHPLKRLIDATYNVSFCEPLSCVNICRTNSSKRLIVEHLSIPPPSSCDTAPPNTVISRGNLLPHRISLTKLIADAHHRHYHFSPSLYNNAGLQLAKCKYQLNSKVKESSTQNLSPILASDIHPSSMFSNTSIRSKSSDVGSGVPVVVNHDSSLYKSKKRVKINACGELYNELSAKRPWLYSKAPKNCGINFEIDYYDSLELIKTVNNSSPPTVCLLHGAPGSFKDYEHLIEYLTSKGVRVIAPNFPPYSATYEYSYRHSPRERVEVLLKFFEAIQILKIDLLIGHSSAVYTMFELLNKTITEPKTTLPGLQINSLGLFNTPSYDLPPNMSPTQLRLLGLKLFDYSVTRPFMMAIVHIAGKIIGIQNRIDINNIEDLLISASAVGYSEPENMVKYLKLVRSFKVPTFMLVGCNDKLIPMKCFEQLKHDLGITSEKQVRQYDNDGKLESDATEPNELVEVSQFASGGHYTFQRFAQQVNRDVHSFLTSKVLPLKAVPSTKL